MPSDGNNKSVNLSCRIEKKIYDELLADAKRKGISLNSLMSSMTKHHVTWKRYADEIGFVRSSGPQKPIKNPLSITASQWQHLSIT